MQILSYSTLGTIALIAALSKLVLKRKEKHPRPLSLLQFSTKISLFAVAILTASCTGILSALALYLTAHRNSCNYVVGRSFWILCSVFGLAVNIKIENKKNLKASPAVFIANHQSTLDVLLMGRVLPKHCAVMAKRSMRWYPFLGWYMYLSECIFIDRKNTAKAKDAMAGAALQMKKTQTSCFIFPEGTRSHLKNAQLLPFKKGAFHLAIQAQVPIVPVVFSGYDTVYDSTDYFFPGGDVIARVLDPIETKGMTAENVEALTALAHERMLAALKEISPVNSAVSKIERSKKAL